MWLHRVKKIRGEGVKVTWKSFSLEQANSKEGPEWEAWEQGDHHQRRSLVAAMAGEAARRQGPDAFDRFHLALLTARHGSDERIPLNLEEPLTRVAQQVGLDMSRFEDDLKDRGLLEIIGRDHIEAVESHGVFGTPTFVFENGNAAFMKTLVPPEDDTASLFDHFLALAADSPYVGELKRPQPPRPKIAVG